MKKNIIFVPERDYLIRFQSKLYPTGIIGKDMRLDEYIRDKRKLHNLTQQELAERAGVGYRFVRELENGKPTVRMDKVNQVLNLFGEELQPAKISNQ